MDMEGRTSIAVLVDKSQSMTGRFAECIQGVCTMIAQARADGTSYALNIAFFSDECHALTGQVGIGVYKGTSGTAAVDAVKQAAVWNPCSGRTRYYDNVVSALKQITNPATSLLVVATDGEDTASTIETADSCKRHIQAFQESGGRLIYLGMADTPQKRQSLRMAAINSGISNTDITVGTIKPIVAAMRSVTGGQLEHEPPPLLNVSPRRCKSAEVPGSLLVPPALRRQETGRHSAELDCTFR